MSEEAGMIPKEALDKALEAWCETPMLGDALTNALEAAAPYLRAQALTEAASTLEADASNSSYSDPEEVAQGQLDAADWLRARAVAERQP